ncbi:phage major capsid protein [Mycobacteroides abscessus]|uniref:phage major capsid protein n=1 Tax=Mycobacteroides abscessus TaxID=36809 RepID=UPI0021040FA7|nr:phage major capsid protein [Mycobacteroides abscessus]
MTFVNLSRSQAVERLGEVHTRMTELSGKHRMSGADETEFEDLGDEFNELNRYINRVDMAQSARGAGAQMRTVPGSPGQDDTPRGDDRRSEAMRTLERAVEHDRLNARGAELVEDLMRTGTPLAQTWMQRYTSAAGSEHYERAFAKLVANPTQGHLTWTPEEADAYRTVSMVQTEQRAMSSTDSAGGYMIPLTLDPAIMLTSGGSINPLRQIARVVQTATDSWQGVTSAGVSAEWTAEAAEVADASPTLAAPSIPVHKGDAFVPFSFEIQGDALGFMSELGALLTDAAEQQNNTAFTTGTGTGQPKGILTALTGTASQLDTTAAATLASGDIYALQNALPPRFQAGAQWCASLGILNTLRQFETGSGALKFPSLQDNPPTLLARKVNELSNMTAATTTGSKLALYGDFRQGFVIVDRIGSTLELVPHLVGANRRPTGQRGALLWYRTGSDVVVPNAFRLLNAK